MHASASVTRDGRTVRVRRVFEFAHVTKLTHTSEKVAASRARRTWHSARKTALTDLPFPAPERTTVPVTLLLPSGPVTLSARQFGRTAPIRRILQLMLGSTRGGIPSWPLAPLPRFYQVRLSRAREIPCTVKARRSARHFNHGTTCFTRREFTERMCRGITEGFLGLLWVTLMLVAIK